VCCVCASNFTEEEESGEKKGKKVLRALEKAIFCSSVLFFEKVFKETRTKATLTTTTLIKKEEKTER
jgi:predicted metal-binding protein